MCVCARLASPGAAVSTRRPCTATQVCSPPSPSLPLRALPSARCCPVISTPAANRTHHTLSIFPEYLTTLPGF